MLEEGLTGVFRTESREVPAIVRIKTGEDLYMIKTPRFYTDIHIQP